MKNLIYLFLIIVISVAILTCSSGLESDYSEETGLINQSGKVVKDTLIYTDTLRFTGNIPVWATNKKFDSIIKDGSDYEIKYPENVLSPNLPVDATEYYKIVVPYSGIGHYMVSYKDTNRLKEIWLNQIFRKNAGDGKVFAIRNRENSRDKDNFQKEEDGRQDYYYFKDNGDIVYKGGDKNNKTGETLMKRFVGAVIVDYRKVTDRTDWHNNNYAADKIEHTGEYTIGGIYKMAITVNEARNKFAGDGPTDGAYDFIAARKMIWFFNNDFVQDKSLFVRQFYTTDFIEVLVLNRYRDWEPERCLGVDAYYAYYGDYRVGEGANPPINGFTHENMPYMTDEKLYLGQRPEYVIPLLTHTTTFADASRDWKFMAMPGHKY